MQQAPAALYAVDVPELVITFYLDRPVTLFPSHGDLERRVPAGRAAYLLIAPRALPTRSTAAREVGTDRLAGRSIAIVAPLAAPEPSGARRTW